MDWGWLVVAVLAGGAVVVGLALMAHCALQAIDE